MGSSKGSSTHLNAGQIASISLCLEHTYDPGEIAYRKYADVKARPRAKCVFETRRRLVAVAMIAYAYAGRVCVCYGDEMYSG